MPTRVPLVMPAPIPIVVPDVTVSQWDAVTEELLVLLLLPISPPADAVPDAEKAYAAPVA